MPKKSNKSNNTWAGRGGRPLNNEGGKQYFGHDDRVRRLDGLHAPSRPRVSFKTQLRPGRELPREMRAALDDDISMTVTPNNNARQVTVRGRIRGLRNSPWPQRGGRIEPLIRNKLQTLGEANWYKIIIPHGHKYSKEYILRNLLSYMQPENFIPIMYKVVGHEAIFYVDDQKTATKLMSCDRKITTNDGFKLIVKVKPGFPQCEIDEELKTKLKAAMEKRYVAETKALDLSKFHQDPDLVTDYFCALFRPLMLMTVLDIVFEHIPDLEALNLDGNKLYIIERLNVLNKKFPNLKILYIGDNKIRELNQIDVIKDLKLEELKLSGNPMCNKYKSRHSDYVSDVRKRFPKLLRLDGVDLPKPILFDVADESIKLPPNQRVFSSNEMGREIASQFLQQYFIIFDSENRQPLLDAYHEHASFSLTCTHNQRFNAYLSENRNIYRLNENYKKRKLLKQGRLPVVSYISELPRTSHNLGTFTMDINLVTQDMMLVIVTGLFKEVNNKDSKSGHFYFNRTFIIVPEGSGYCIMNEQLHIGLPTEEQEKQATCIQIVPTPVSVSPSTSGMAVGPVSEEVKQQMTMTLSQQTNMNLEWSLKCLEEVQWNYDNALAAFQEFFKRGQVPPEAFNK